MMDPDPFRYLPETDDVFYDLDEAGGSPTDQRQGSPKERSEESHISTTTTTSSSCASPITETSSYSSMSPPVDSCPQRRRTSFINREVLKTEKDFIDYIMSLPPTDETVPTSSEKEKLAHSENNAVEMKAKAKVPFNLEIRPHQEEIDTSSSSSRAHPLATSPSKKMGLDHLDNLCKLMEQLAELRVANTKLKRRVQYLEECRQSSSRCQVPFHTAARSEASDNIHSQDGGNEAKRDRLPNGRIYKSKTIGSVGVSRERSQSTGLYTDLTKTKKRFPKWSRVKEALGLDKGGRRVLTSEMAGALGIPVFTDLEWGSATSPEDWYSERRESEQDCLQKELKGEGEGELKKCSSRNNSKSPWRRVKTMIQTRRDSLKQRRVSGRRSCQESMGDGSDEKEAVHYEISQYLSATSSSGCPQITLEEMQRNITNDFSKKLEDWENMKRCSLKEGDSKHGSSKESKRKQMLKKDRVEGKEASEKPYEKRRAKDLSWLEKELHKVEEDMQRLNRERQKAEKRSARLMRLRDAMLRAGESRESNEILVKTSAGEFRFEGISDAFTKKLYEWELKQGVNPELSTIALLDTSGVSPDNRLTRSRSEHSLPDPSPPSSLDSLPASFSRANTEPNLANPQRFESPPNSPDEKMEFIFPEGEERKPHNETAYYSLLLEDNVYLLNQLKTKEEICKRLQQELQSLDDKTEEMNKRHQLQMERYRTKLWEIHKAKPRDFQGALKLIAELKVRIEELQRCSDKLKSDREALEESFQYHSEQQARLADDLISKMKELQEVSKDRTDGCGEARWKRAMLACDPEKVERLHEITTLLLQQARDVEKSLCEKSREVCRLQWELLHRDVSAVLVHSGISSAGRGRGCRRAWSTSEGLQQTSEVCGETAELLRLRRLDCPKMDYTPTDLLATVQELQRVVLRLATLPSPPSPPKDSPTVENAQVQQIYPELIPESAESEMGSVVNSRSSSFSSEMFGSPPAQFGSSLGSLSGSWPARSSSESSLPREEQTQLYNASFDPADHSKGFLQRCRGLYVLSSSMPRLPTSSSETWGLEPSSSRADQANVRRETSTYSLERASKREYCKCSGPANQVSKQIVIQSLQVISPSEDETSNIRSDPIVPTYSTRYTTIEQPNYPSISATVDTRPLLLVGDQEKFISTNSPSQHASSPSSSLVRVRETALLKAKEDFLSKHSKQLSTGNFQAKEDNPCSSNKPKLRIEDRVVIGASASDENDTIQAPTERNNSSSSALNELCRQSLQPSLNPVLRFEGNLPSSSEASKTRTSTWLPDLFRSK